MLREIVEKLKITDKKTDKVIQAIEKVVGSKYDVEVEFYGGEGVDPLFSISPIPKSDVVSEVEGILKKLFKKNSVRARENNGYVSFMIK